MRKGFTLVELSIVLVIIGLLIGGILVAQSLIGSSAQKGTIKQLSQYDIAVGNFNTRYGGLPGDSTVFNNDGNNNGRIGSIIFGEYAEIGNFWSDLSKAVSLKNIHGADYAAFDALGDTMNDNLTPAFKLRHRSGQPFLGVLDWDYGEGEQNYYIYALAIDNAGIMNTGGGPYDVLTPADVSSLDAKIDDGKPEHGGLMAFTATSPTNCATGTSPNTVYDLSNTDFVCHMIISIGHTGQNF